jgi:hypothetical protein
MFKAYQSLILVLSFSGLSFSGLSFSLLLAGTAQATSVHCSEALDRTHTVNEVVNAYLKSYKAVAKGVAKTSGIEIEATVPADLGVQGIAEAAAKFLESKYGKVQKRFSWHYLERGYQQRRFKLIFESNGDKSKELIFTEDLSVLTETGRRPIEIISPILRKFADYDDFMEIIDLARSLGAKAEPNSAGVHFHQGFSDPKSAELGLMIIIQKKLEPDLFDFARTSASRKAYVAELSPKLSEDAESGLFTKFGVSEILEKYFPLPHDRYRALNVAALKKFGTIEDRIANSTLDSRIITFFHRFFSNLRYAIRSKDPALLKLLSEHDSDITVLNMAVTLGFDGKEVIEIRDLIRQEAEAEPRSNLRTKTLQLASTPRLWYQNIFVPIFSSKSVPIGWRAENIDFMGTEIFSASTNQKFKLNLVGRSPAERKFKIQADQIDSADSQDLIPVEWVFSPFYMPLGHTTLRVGNTVYEMKSDGFRIHGDATDNARSFYFNNPFFRSQYNKFMNVGMAPFSMGIEFNISKTQLTKFLEQAENKIITKETFSLLFNNCNQCIIEMLDNTGADLPTQKSGFEGFSSVTTFKQLLLSNKFTQQGVNLYPSAGAAFDAENTAAYVPTYLYELDTQLTEISRIITQWPLR